MFSKLGSRPRWLVVAVLAFAMIAVGFSSQAQAHGDDDDDEREARGFISVSVSSSTVVVGGVPMMVDGGTEIEIGDDESVTLTELAEYVDANGATLAEAEYVVAGEFNRATDIEIEEDDEDEDEVKGPLSIDLAGSSVTIGGVTLSVTGSTQIEVGDDEDNATLAELDAYVTANPGVFAEGKFTFQGDVRVATRIETKGGRDDDGDNDDDDENELFGPLSVDVAQSTVTVANVTLLVTAGTEIEVDEEDRLSLTELADYLTANPGTVGDVEFRVINNQLVAREIEVYSFFGRPVNENELSGTLTEIDFLNNLVRFQPTAGNLLTLRVSFNTEVELNGAEMQLAELYVALPRGATPNARVHYDPFTLEVRELHVTLPVQVSTGQVTAVNARTGEVKVKSGARGAVTKMIVLKGATIVRRGKVVRLKDLRPKDRVRLNVFRSRNRRLATELTTLR